MAEEIRAQSYVGFDSITQQIEHKLLKRGFQFNVIVVGKFLPSFSPQTILSGFALLAGQQNEGMVTGRQYIVRAPSSGELSPTILLSFRCYLGLACKIE